MKNFKSALILAAAALLAVASFSGCKSSVSTAGTGGSGRNNEPNVTFKNLQGQRVSLAGLKGKVVLVNFWATWCDPCRSEIPMLIGLQNKYASQGFTLLGVAMDDGGKRIVDPFVEKTQFDVDGHQETMDYPIVLGNDDIASKFGGLLGMPTSFLISRNGKIVKKYIGMLNRAEITKDVKNELATS